MPASPLTLQPGESLHTPGWHQSISQDVYGGLDQVSSWLDLRWRLLDIFILAITLQASGGASNAHINTLEQATDQWSIPVYNLSITIHMVSCMSWELDAPLQAFTQQLLSGLTGSAIL